MQLSDLFPINVVPTKYIVHEEPSTSLRSLTDPDYSVQLGLHCIIMRTQGCFPPFDHPAGQQSHISFQTTDQMLTSLLPSHAPSPPPQKVGLSEVCLLMSKS